MRERDQLRLELSARVARKDVPGVQIIGEPSTDLALVLPPQGKGKGRDPSSLMETLIDQAESSVRSLSGLVGFP